LACGTGRATIPLGSKGHPLIGVDIHKGMLNRAKKKSNALDLPIEWIEQDCTNLNLNVKSPLIYMVGNSFQHFLTNEKQNQLLTSVNEHLESEGIFIFGTRFPSAEELLHPSIEEYWRTYTNRDGKVIDEKRTKISLRYVFPKEMERILFENGFEILSVFKDWNETPLTNDSYQMIYVCNKMR
jgi:ubiquinone/menaquinone biosynthesis C-methylase UbiE